MTQFIPDDDDREELSTDSDAAFLRFVESVRAKTAHTGALRAARHSRFACKRRRCVYFIPLVHIGNADMRTNIDIDDALMERALKVSGLATKKAAVEAGLRMLIRMRNQASVRAAFGKIPLTVDLDRSRQGRRL